MKPETIEALALELTKATINERSKHESSFDITDPELWLYEYTKALEKLNKACDGYSTEQALGFWQKL